jgi:hypothetical protein
MKKIEYKAPEMEVIKMKAQTALLNMSSGDAEIPTEKD